MSTEPGVAVLVEITSSANEPVLVPADLGGSQAAAEGVAVVRHSPEPGGGGRAFASNRQKEVIMTHMSITTAAVGLGRGAARSSRSGRPAGKPDRHSDRVRMALAGQPGGRRQSQLSGGFWNVLTVGGAGRHP